MMALTGKSKFVHNRAALINIMRRNKKWNLKIPPPEQIGVKTNNYKGFTLAEVLITLVIIGIVAAA